MNARGEIGLPYAQGTARDHRDSAIEIMDLFLGSDDRMEYGLHCDDSKTDEDSTEC